MLLFCLTGFTAPITIPGTQITIEPPRGWNSAPGQQGAVLTLASPDGLAQIMINTMIPQNGMTMEQFFTSIHDQIAQNMAQDQASGWQSIEDSQQVQNAIMFRFRNYQGSLGQAANMQLGFVFAKTSSHLLVFNVAMNANRAAAYGQAIRTSLLSIKDPAMAPTTSKPLTGMRAPASQPSRPATESPALQENLELEVQVMTLLEQAPTNQQLIDNLASVRAAISIEYWKAKKMDDAVAFMSSSVKLNPKDPVTLNLFGDILDDVAEPAAPYLAQSYYEDALKLDPSMRECRKKLAALYQSTGDFEDALRHYQILTDNNGGPPDPTFFREMTLCYITSDREDDGIAFSRKMAERGSVHFGITYSILLNQKGQTQTAVQTLRYMQNMIQETELKQYAAALADGFEKGAAN